MGRKRITEGGWVAGSMPSKANGRWKLTPARVALFARLDLQHRARRADGTLLPMTAPPAPSIPPNVTGKGGTAPTTRSKQIGMATARANEKAYAILDRMVWKPPLRNTLQPPKLLGEEYENALRAVATLIDRYITLIERAMETRA